MLLLRSAPQQLYLRMVQNFFVFLPIAGALVKIYYADDAPIDWLLVRGTTVNMFAVARIWIWNHILCFPFTFQFSVVV